MLSFEEFSFQMLMQLVLQIFVMVYSK